MLSLANRILLVVLTALLLGAAPALAEPETTGGLPAGEPPVLSPQGGVAGTDVPAPPPAAAAQTESPGEPPPTTPTAPAPEEPSGEDAPAVDAPEPADPAPETESAVTGSASSGGGGLPRTGFALAALIALGVCFVLTGYALRYSRALDG